MKPLGWKPLEEAAIGALVGVAAFHVVFALLAKAAVMILVMTGPCCTGYRLPIRGEADRKRIERTIDRIKALEPGGRVVSPPGDPPGG